MANNLNFSKIKAKQLDIPVEADGDISFDFSEDGIVVSSSVIDAAIASVDTKVDDEIADRKLQ